MVVVTDAGFSIGEILTFIPAGPCQGLDWEQLSDPGGMVDAMNWYKNS